MTCARFRIRFLMRADWSGPFFFNSVFIIINTIRKRASRARISPCKCTGWSGPSLPAIRIHVFGCGFHMICITAGLGIQIATELCGFRAWWYLILRKHAYSNILKTLPPKNENFRTKTSDIFHISAENINCGYSLEPPRWGGSNEYPQSMFSAEIRKIMYTPVNPSFTI